MTCLENVIFPLKYNKSVKAKDYQALAKAALNKVGLEEKYDSYPNELSGGQQQRVAIARALINQPALLLADEPTGNLDSATSELIMDLFSELNKSGTTILLVTHDSDVASRCSRKLLISDGVIQNNE